MAVLGVSKQRNSRTDWLAKNAIVDRTVPDPHIRRSDVRRHYTACHGYQLIDGHYAHAPRIPETISMRILHCIYTGAVPALGWTDRALRASVMTLQVLIPAYCVIAEWSKQGHNFKYCPPPPVGAFVAIFDSMWPSTDEAPVKFCIALLRLDTHVFSIIFRK